MELAPFRRARYLNLLLLLKKIKHFLNLFMQKLAAAGRTLFRFIPFRSYPILPVWYKILSENESVKLNLFTHKIVEAERKAKEGMAPLFLAADYLRTPSNRPTLVNAEIALSRWAG